MRLLLEFNDDNGTYYYYLAYLRQTSESVADRVNHDLRALGLDRLRATIVSRLHVD